MTEEHLRTGDKATVRFRFIKNPEYLKTDMRMVFREGRTKAVGNITKLFPHVSAVAQNTRHQRAAKKSSDVKHSTNPQNEPQKASKRNRRLKKSVQEFDVGEGKSESISMSTRDGVKGSGDASSSQSVASSLPSTSQSSTLSSVASVSQSTSTATAAAN